MWALVSTAASSQDLEPPPAPVDWGVALREDARAFHDLIAENHPGPVDPLNPRFNATLETGLALALERAETAETYEDWYFGLQTYQASFDDGHLTLADLATMGHVWTLGWAGLITGLRAGPDGVDRYEVVHAASPEAALLGSVLTGCDGRSAEALAASFVGSTAGRWSLRSRRANYAGTLLIDQKNPYVARPEVCEFVKNGVGRSHRMVWRDLPAADQATGFAAASSPRYFSPVGLETWSGGVWIGLGQFESDPATPAGRDLVALTEAVARKTGEIRAAPRVVFDLRGNNGGSSLWITTLARTLWGDDRVDALKPLSQGTDWRASPGNVARMQHYRDVILADDPGGREWAASAATGMEEALREGQAFWSQVNGQTRPARPSTPSPMTGRIYVLTDYGCGSACLDAVDLLKAMGAVQVGQETSADTLYMDIREIGLPSRRATAIVPMKVYRGRRRGNNETAVPAHVWTGDLSDTAGIRDWLLTLESRS